MRKRYFNMILRKQNKVVPIILVIVLFISGCTGIVVSPTVQVNDSPGVTQTERPDPPGEETEPVETSESLETTLTSTSISSNSVSPDDLDGIAVRFVHPWDGAGGEKINEIATQFSLSNPWGIWIDVEGMGSETVLLDSLQSDLETGDVPDLIAVHPYKLSDLDGAITPHPLNDYFNHPDFGFSIEEKDDIPEVFLEQFMVDNTLTALPIAPQAMVMFYNQTWAEELGFSAPPEYVEDFRQQVCAATTANLGDEIEDNDGTGGFPRNFDPRVLASWYRAFDGQIPETGTLSFNNDAGRQAFGFLKSVDTQGCIWIHRQPDPFWYFANRYALMYAGTLDQIAIQKGWMEASQGDDTWMVTGFPGQDQNFILVDGPGLMITAEKPDEQLATWLFAKHLLKPEIQEQLVRSLITLPVRNSAQPLLVDFSKTYPQWAQAISLIEIAEPLPISDEWGISQFVLQDAIIRLMQVDEDQTNLILEELDMMINELEDGTP